eukprot:Mycagemm_TRINITY_DN10295_c2_g1::TRINITY_DN10295_c2_g1_i1::g.4085::m.4085 type:complete len:163 gc:universal TRINITY_DN10295_c2_g1_i1:590-102(-)
MRPGNRPQAAIVLRCILECNPETNSRVGDSVHKCTILVCLYLATDAWLLKDIHRLQNDWVSELNVHSQLAHLVLMSKLAEQRIEIGKSVAYLINAPLLWLLQLALLIKGILLEKVGNLIPTRQEVLVGGGSLFKRGEDGNRGGVKARDQAFGLRAKLVAGFQ